MLHPQTRALIKLVESLGAPPMNELSVAQARAIYLDRRHGTQPVAPVVAQVTDRRIAVNDGQITVRDYRPALLDAGAALLPALIYFHGGGWTIGDLDTHDTLCRSLCLKSDCAVFSVDYRMGPECKFPTAVNDADTAVKWLFDQAETLGINANRIAVGGDSAGGNLAAVASLLARDRGGPAPAFQLLIYPAVDQRAGHDSHQRNGTGYLLTLELMAWFRAQYHTDPKEHLDWRASPILAPSLKDVAPALVITAQYDPLVDEGQAFVQALEAAGVAVQHVEFAGQVHGFITMGKLLDDANRAVDLCAQVLRDQLSN